MTNRIHVVVITALAVLTIAFLSPFKSLAGSGIGVLVGGGADYDACGTVGKVANLNPQGDNFLAVRSGPGSNYEQIDSLYTDDRVFMCDQRGRWLGVVYGPPGHGCGVSSPIAVRRIYGGPCRSGWVFEKYIRGFAG